MLRSLPHTRLRLGLAGPKRPGSLALASGLLALSLSCGLLLPAAAQTQAASPPATGAQAAPGTGSPAASEAGTKPGTRAAAVSAGLSDASTQPGYAEQDNGQRMKVQPGNNAPLWRQVGAGVAGSSSLPERTAPEAGVLVQPTVQYPGLRPTTAGEAWRQLRNRWLIPYGGALLLIVLGAIGLFYWRRGPMALHGPETGRRIERFTPFERSAHWANAIAFCVLAVSGLVMAFGKFLLLPLMGGTLFGWLTYTLKTLHNFAGPLFAVSLAVVALTFVRDNLPRREDWLWLRQGGGLWSGEEVPSHRFNAGEKLVFWAGVLGLGLLVVLSGLALDHLLPGVDSLRHTLQLAEMVHLAATVLMMALFAGHIYMGTVGMDGAYQAMKTGEVDETWAREHHRLWHEDIAAGKIPARRSPPQTPHSNPAAAQV